jgi:hypothetical protein
MIDALTHIYDDENEKGATRLEAGSLLGKMEELEFVFMLHLWNNLLHEFHKTSMALQDSKIALTTCANLYKSLSRYVKNIREKFDDIEEEAKSRLPAVEYKSTVKRKQANNGAAVLVPYVPHLVRACIPFSLRSPRMSCSKFSYRL